MQLKDLRKVFKFLPLFLEQNLDIQNRKTYKEFYNEKRTSSRI